MKISRLSATLLASLMTAWSLPVCSAQDSTVYLISSGDFNVAANWNIPEFAPGTNLIDVYGVDDGLSATFSGGTTTVFGLRIGSGAKEHYFFTSDENHFGRLTMTGGTLEVIGSAAMGWFVIGRERENIRLLGDYNKDAVVNAADYTVWRNTLGSVTDLVANGDNTGTSSNLIDQADYNFWKSGFGDNVKGGELILTGTSTVTANGLIVGERTKGLLSIGLDSLVDLRTWDTSVEPNQFGGSEDMRVGGYGPAYNDFGGEPGLNGNGLVDVQGTLNAKDMYLSEHGARGELRVDGGTVNLNGALIMDFCGGCVTNPALLALRSARVSMVGSGGVLNVGLDPDPLIIDPMPPNRNLLAASPTATFSFTADAGGVTPITIVENTDEPSGTAEIEGAKLVLDLDAYDFTSTSFLTLIDAPAGQLLGEFGTVTFVGSTTATVRYNIFNGDVLLENFQTATGSGAGLAVPEPSNHAALASLVGLLLMFVGRRHKGPVSGDSSD